MKKHLLLVPSVIAWAFSSSAFAGYAQLKPPQGFTPSTATSPATYAKAANEAWLQKTVRTSASLNVGGRAVTVPVSMRLSANAGQYLTGRIGAGLLGGPAGLAVTAGLLVLPSVIDWYSQQSIYKWQPIGQRWETTDGDSMCDASGWTGIPIGSSSNAGCGGYGSGTVILRPVGGSCEVGNSCHWALHYGNVPMRTNSFPREAAWPEVQPALGPLPIGDPLLNEPKIPFPWPVQQPVINPAPNPDPLAQPQEQPLLVPTGDPIPNPNYNPQQAPSPTNQPYIQPAVRIKPSPTPDNPWRVDVEPVEQPVSDPNGLPDPVKPETPETPKEPEAPPTDTPLGPVPDLYERKYPDGMEGVWNTYKDQLKNTSLGTLASKLMPNIPDGGTCPQWPINLDMAQWAAFGTHDVAPPCYIWGIAKAILIVSALLLARALIFGG